MNFADWLSQAKGAWTEFLRQAAAWSRSPDFYIQLAAIAGAAAIAGLVAWLMRAKFGDTPHDGERTGIKKRLQALKFAVFPLLMVLLLAAAARIAGEFGHQQWLIRFAESAALIYLLFAVISRFVTSGFVRTVARWVGVPIAALAVFGWLDEVTEFLDGIKLTAGNIQISLYTLARTLIFGSILFWLGRLSNAAGKNAIRRQEHLELGTREVFVKLFEIGVFVLVFLLLLQVMGINLTALAVFGGALGVGLGFGLQQIASNFISGIIILLDRSLTIGDHVELQDGRSGTLRELNMRFGVLETYDGKDVVVPNEQFITQSYTNWTHKDPLQRYSLEFQVAYATDLDALFEDLRDLCKDHPQVLSGDEYAVELQPDAEIAGYGDSGIDVLVEYWIRGVDDGPNRIGADLLLGVYHLFRDKGYEFPFPQREVRVLNPAAGETSMAPRS